MAQRSVSARIDDMLEMIAEIRIAETSEGSLPARTIKLAMERAFSILSEASRYIPDELKQSEPEVPWKDIAGMGNILRHDYQRVSEDVLRNAAARHLDDLRHALVRIKARIDRDQGT